MADEIQTNGPKRPDADWRAVYVTHNIQDAYIVAGRLESEGITTFIHRVAGAAALGIFIGTLGEISVLVRPQDYKRALDILEPEDADMLPDSTDPVIFPPDDDEDENDDQ